MKSGSWSSYQAALPPEARAGGERDDEPTSNELIQGIVGDFSGRLSAMLVANGRGVAWRESAQSWLLMRLRQEVEELAYAIDHGTTEQQDKECLDVAAFAMMILDRERQPGAGE